MSDDLELSEQDTGLKQLTLRELNDDQLYNILTLFACGYTARYISVHMVKQYGVVLSDMELLKGGVLFAAKVEEIRKELAKKTLSTGLSRKEERLRRMGTLAEAYEEGALAGNIKSANVYLKTLAQIHDEVEPLRLILEYEKEDPWYQLMDQVKRQVLTKPASKQLSTSSESTPTPNSGQSSETTTEPSSSQVVNVEANPGSQASLVQPEHLSEAGSGS
jgi:hypothetical protein